MWGLKIRPYVAGRNILKCEKVYKGRAVWITLLVFLPLPLIMATPIATEILIYGIFALGFNLLLGHTGILSFGHATYFGLGSYFTGIALGLWVSVFSRASGRALLGALLAVIIGALTIRKRGVYFAMISLAFGQMFYFLALSPLKKWTGGEDGLKFIPVLRLDYPFHVDLAKPCATVLLRLCDLCDSRSCRCGGSSIRLSADCCRRSGRTKIDPSRAGSISP